MQDVLPLIIGSAGNFQTVVFGALLVLIFRAAPHGLWPVLFGPPPVTVPPKVTGDARLASRPAIASGETLLEVSAGEQALRRLACRQRCRLHRSKRRDRRADRTEWRRQEHDLQPDLRVASAEYPATFSFASRSISGRTPQQIAGIGIARTFQHAHLVGDMSVRENAALGAHLRGHAGMVRAIFRRERTEEGLLFAEADRQLHRVGLEKEAGQIAGNLALGQLRLLEVARALALDPVLLLLDEPAAGLRYGEKRELAKLLRQFRGEGVGILLVEHDMDFVMSLADRLVVLDFGTRIAEGVPAEIRSNPKVIAAYLGGVA